MVKDYKADKKDDPVTQFFNKNYVMFSTLTLDVTNIEGVSPSLSFLDILAPITRAMLPSINFTGIVGGQVTGTQHRNVNLTFTLYLDKNRILPGAQNQCDPLGTRSLRGIKGNLGLKEIIVAGVKSTNYLDFLFPAVTDGDRLKNVIIIKDKGKLPPGLSTAVPAFASTIDFTLVYGINGGPNWTLQTFKGPSGGGGGMGMMSGGSSGTGMQGGGSNGLANINRAIKDTLIVSLAPAGPSTTPQPFTFLSLGAQNNYLLEHNQTPKPKVESILVPTPPDPADATAGATYNAQRLILQNTGFPLVP